MQAPAVANDKNMDKRGHQGVPPRERYPSRLVATMYYSHELPSPISYPSSSHTDLILPQDNNPPAVARDMLLPHPSWDNSCRLPNITPLNDLLGRNDPRGRKEGPTGSLTGVNSPLPHKRRQATHVIDPQTVNLYGIFQPPVRHTCYFMSSLSSS